MKSIYIVGFLLLIPISLYSLQLTYTLKYVNDEPIEITMHMKDRIMAGKPFPIAQINEQSIYDMIIASHPNKTTISWDNQTMILADNDEEARFISRYTRIPSANTLFNIQRNLFENENVLKDFPINKRAESTLSFVEQEENVEIKDNTMQITKTFSIDPIETGPMQIKNHYNYFVKTIEKRMRSQISKYRSIYFNKIPI
jgi:hypothetical protein